MTKEQAELTSAAHCVLAWIDRKTDTGRLAAERLERALAGVKENESTAPSLREPEELLLDLERCAHRFIDREPVLALIAADRAAAKLAVISEIEAALVGFFRRNPDHRWTQILPTTIRELRFKYQQGPNA